MSRHFWWQLYIISKWTYAPTSLLSIKSHSNSLKICSPHPLISPTPLLALTLSPTRIQEYPSSTSSARTKTPTLNPPLVSHHNFARRIVSKPRAQICRLLHASPEITKLPFARDLSPPISLMISLSSNVGFRCM